MEKPRRKGRMLGVDFRFYLLSGATAVAPTFNIGCEAFLRYEPGGLGARLLGDRSVEDDAGVPWYEPGMPALVRWVVFFTLAFLTSGCAHQGSSTEASSPETTQILPTVDESSKPAPTSVHLHLVSSVWAPFTDVEEMPHVALDVVHEAMHRAGIAYDSAIIDFVESIDGIRQGRFDGSEALWKTSEREKFILYSEPYLENRLVLLARVGTDVSAQKLADLAGKKVGLVRGFGYGPEVDSVTGVDFQRNADDATNLRALLRGELDYMLVDDLVLHRLFSDHPKKAELLLVGGQAPMVVRGLHLGLRKDLPGASSIILEFNRAIAKLSQDGTYNHLLGVHWIATDTDQDGTPELVAGGTQVGAAPPAQHYRIAGSTTAKTPRFVIEGRTYEDWQSVPSAYKVPPKEGIERFQPALSVVLLEF